MKEFVKQGVLATVRRRLRRMGGEEGGREDGQGPGPGPGRGPGRGSGPPTRNAIVLRDLHDSLAVLGEISGKLGEVFTGTTGGEGLGMGLGGGGGGGKRNRKDECCCVEIARKEIEEMVRTVWGEWMKDVRKYVRGGRVAGRGVKRRNGGSATDNNAAATDDHDDHDDDDTNDDKPHTNTTKILSPSLEPVDGDGGSNAGNGDGDDDDGSSVVCHFPRRLAGSVARMVECLGVYDSVLGGLGRRVGRREEVRRVAGEGVCECIVDVGKGIVMVGTGTGDTGDDDDDDDDDENGERREAAAVRKGITREDMVRIRVSRLLEIEWVTGKLLGNGGSGGGATGGTTTTGKDGGGMLDDGKVKEVIEEVERWTDVGMVRGGGGGGGGP